MFTVIGDRIGRGGIDDDRAIHSHRLLHAGVAVIPIGARLLDGELVHEGLAGLDPRKAHPRHAIHLEGHEQPVPMNRGFLVQRVAHGEANLLALL